MGIEHLAALDFDHIMKIPRKRYFLILGQRALIDDLSPLPDGNHGLSVSASQKKQGQHCRRYESQSQEDIRFFDHNV